LETSEETRSTSFDFCPSYGAAETEKEKQKMSASWRTTLFGVGGIVTVVAAACNALFDGNPATNPDWTSVIASISACVGLLFARDNVVTSEQSGAK